MQRSHAVLEFCGLGDKRYQKIDGYSTGQKQRVKLAQALVHDPKLLLLDEPTNGLDPDGRDEMLALIQSLPARTGCAILLSSHLLHDVERVCERAILLAPGRGRLLGDDRGAAQRGAGGPLRGARQERRRAAQEGARGARLPRRGGRRHAGGARAGVDGQADRADLHRRRGRGAAGAPPVAQAPHARERVRARRRTTRAKEVLHERTRAESERVAAARAARRDPRPGLSALQRQLHARGRALEADLRRACSR